MSGSQLMLRTVQFGVNYGITNAAGQEESPAATQLPLRAEAVGVCWLDQAHA